MKVDVIGGGPAGLYFAILAKKAWPVMRITVYERNRPDDTFGFGVVFSDETLETFEKYDLESYRAITASLPWASVKSTQASMWITSTLHAVLALAGRSAGSERTNVKNPLESVATSSSATQT